jgi:hypothetical protein
MLNVEDIANIRHNTEGITKYGQSRDNRQYQAQYRRDNQIWTIQRHRQYQAQYPYLVIPSVLCLILAIVSGLSIFGYPFGIVPDIGDVSELSIFGNSCSLFHALY